MKRHAVARWSDLEPGRPAHALVANVDLVVTRSAHNGTDQVSVLYDRFLHRSALMADGYVDGHNLICGLHAWDDRLDTGVSEYNNDERLHKFNAWIEDAAELAAVRFAGA